MKRYKTVYKKVYIQNNVFQFQRNCRNKDRYSPTRRSLIWRPSSTTSPKSEALENAVARSLRFAVPRHQHRVCATHCTGWSREGRRRKGERKAARAGERQTRRGRKDKRDKENEGRERERAVVVPWRAIYGTFHFFSSLFIPAPSLPTILPLPPPRRYTGCTRVRTLPLSSSPSLVPVHSFVESPLAFSAHETRNGRWWWWMATQVEVANDSLLSTLFIHSSTSPSLPSSPPRSDERRGTPRNCSERKVAANEVAIQPFYHRSRHDRGRGGGERRETGPWRQIYLEGPVPTPFVSAYLTRDPSLMSQ